MYGYIYDVFLSQKPYEKEVIKIEHSLTDQGLNGHIVRLSLVNSVQHAVEDLLKRGVSTIVAVGSDQLFSKLCDEIAHRQGITIGLIPLGKHQKLASIFGIPQGADACKIVAARLVRPVRLSKVNSAFFIHSCVLFDARAKVFFDDHFSLTPTAPEAQIAVYNTIESNPQTGEQRQRLSAVITPAEGKKLFKKPEPLEATAIKATRIIIPEPRGVPVIIDGQKVINTPVTLETSEKQVQVIMGKERKL